MSVPESVRDDMRDLLRSKADEMGWLRLPTPQKSKLYEQWSRDPRIGGILAGYIDSRRVRVYIKDTLLKDYVRRRLADDALPFRALELSTSTPVAEVYIKPHGRRLRDGRVICWGRADDWKSILLAVYERAFQPVGRSAFGAVLFRAVGRYGQDDARKMVEDAGFRLGLERVVWLEP